MSKTLDTICGIYSTEYTLTRHRNGSCTVKSPYIKWSDNLGVLAHKKIKIKPAQTKDVVWFFDNGVTYSDITELTLDAEIYNSN
jgi:hypothetical protein